MLICKPPSTGPLCSQAFNALPHFLATIHLVKILQDSVFTLHSIQYLLALTLPLTYVRRPGWDSEMLKFIGFTNTSDRKLSVSVLLIIVQKL